MGEREGAGADRDHPGAAARRPRAAPSSASSGGGVEDAGVAGDDDRVGPPQRLEAGLRGRPRSRSSSRTGPPSERAGRELVERLAVGPRPPARRPAPARSGRRRRGRRGRGRPRGAWQKSSEHWHSCLWRRSAPARQDRGHGNRDPHLRQAGRPRRGRPLRSDAQRPRLGRRSSSPSRRARCAPKAALGLDRRPRARRSRPSPTSSSSPAAPATGRCCSDEELLAWLREVDRDDEMDDLGLHRLAGARRRRPARGQAGDRELARPRRRCASTAPTRSAAASSRTAR